MTIFANPIAAAKVCRVALAATAALALSLTAAAGIAQPAGGMMHGGPGGHGMRGGVGIEQMIPHLLEKAKASLNLDSSQQATWEALVKQSKAVHDAARTNRQRLKTAMTEELAKPAPDLAAVAAIADSVEQDNRTARKALRDQWIAFYTRTFTPEQKAVVRDLLQKKMARAEAFHHRMLERVREHLAPSGG